MQSATYKPDKPNINIYNVNRCILFILYKVVLPFIFLILIIIKCYRMIFNNKRLANIKVYYIKK
jgi:hypothetical protein